MKVDWFRLSGTDYYGDEAQRMFAIAREHGFDRIGGDFAPWPCRRDALPHFVADVSVSGVAASAQVSFDSPGALLDFLRYAPLTKPSEPGATECYHQLVGYTPQEVPDGGR